MGRNATAVSAVAIAIVLAIATLVLRFDERRIPMRSNGHGTDSTAPSRGDLEPSDLTPAVSIPVATTPAAPDGVDRAALRTAANERLRVRASAGAMRVIGKALEDSFETVSAIDLVLQGDSDRGAIDRVILGEVPAALVLVAPSATDLEQGLAEQVIGWHILALVVHRTMPLCNMTGRAMREVLTGQAASWSTVGLPAQPIELVTTSASVGLDRASTILILGDRITGKALLLPDEHAVLEHVKHHPHSLGVVGLAALRGFDGARALMINDVLPSRDSVMGRRYEHGCAARILYRGTPGQALRALLDHCASAAARARFGEHLTVQ